MNRIVFTNEAQTLGRIIWDGGECFGPLPPESGEFLPIYERLIADGVVPEVYVAPPPAVPETISDRQFAQALALAGTITQDEALAWAARGDLPKVMTDALAKIPEDGGQRFGARMMLSAATTYQRSHPLVPMLGSLLTNPATGSPYDAAALDALWTAAAAL